MDDTAPLHLTLPDAEATARLAERLAGGLRAGDTLLLSGPIGAGKSHFARALIRALTTPEQEVPSPTFTLVQDYATARGPLWHMDLYRLGAVDELVELGVEDALGTAVCLIEWPERLGEMTPADHVALALEPAADSEARVAHLSGYGAGWTRLRPLAEGECHDA
ncbi:tRNA (adenosine(37)-N6)-threonylcarbamoyltransferase complex ATPase subunit type 1 TsaE [Pontivivens ytuae]|uniref:tRNA threonylcarbamoyladenosine biosynthesis protein TsaE n=1 Tax=Pontivivens ytuae TaxID=2789856 RepID=A0A7S9LP91_9RHOB|nr:tRNA (adenosine(37)-N6)-threonylcarbamoyltransferase complex ATPase subunit type 1 TsaE [Pontivivens ytuae]QPH52754.1 tRNA (adenosine(37)-N6)-threonylcarbamoyltransferase complex ATPase subunit type 1 TsaE [Pontivivens ytuae]